MTEKCLISIRVYLYLSVCQFYMTRFIVLCTLGHYLYTCQYTYGEIYIRTIKDKEYHTCMCLTYLYHTCLADKTSQYSPFSLQQSCRFLFLKVISTHFPHEFVQTFQILLVTMSIYLNVCIVNKYTIHLH